MYDTNDGRRGQYSLADARLEPWAILMGRHNGGDDRRRPHRGLLPDVDRDVPRPPRRSLGERMAALAGWLAGFIPTASPSLQAPSAKMGESNPVAYIEEARLARSEGAKAGTTARAA